MLYIVKSAWHLVVHLVGTGDVVLAVLALAGQTNSIPNDSESVSANLIRQAIMRGHCGATRRPDGDDDCRRLPVVSKG